MYYHTNGEQYYGCMKNEQREGQGKSKQTI